MEVVWEIRVYWDLSPNPAYFDLSEITKPLGYHILDQCAMKLLWQSFVSPLNRTRLNNRAVLPPPPIGLTVCIHPKRLSVLCRWISIRAVTHSRNSNFPCNVFWICPLRFAKEKEKKNSISTVSSVPFTLPLRLLCLIVLFDSRPWRCGLWPVLHLIIYLLGLWNLCQVFGRSLPALFHPYLLTLQWQLLNY